jgi:pimeloyl-ACP methyl ester carboxylesterase
MTHPASIRPRIALAISLMATALVACSGKAPTEAELLAYEGTYEVAPGHRIVVGASNEQEADVFWLDLKTLKVGALDWQSGDVFADRNDKSLQYRFLRTADGALGDVELVQAGAATKATRVRPHVREAVSFTSHGRTLRGDLYLPTTPGPHPVVVFAHGSGPATRRVGPFAPYFLQLGIGVLTFDKQGAGESEGEWQTADFASLADDVVAGVEFVKARPDVDAKRIGLLGSSQGGWIGSMAAARSKDVSFLLVRVGPGENVRDTMLHEKRGQFMAEGITDAKDLDEGVELYRRVWALAASGGTWEQGQAVFDEYSTRPWFKQAFGEERATKTEDAVRWWTWLGKNLAYDSTEYLRTVQVPVFWALAEKDWNVNSQVGAPRLVAALAGNPDATVRILPGMGHTGLTVVNGLPNDAISWRYAPGYWDGMEAWLTERGIAR